MLTVAQILKQTRLVTCFTSPTIFETSASGARALGVTYRGLGSIAGRTTKGWMADRVSVSPFIYHANSRECTKMAMHTELSNAGRLLVRRGAAIPLCTALLATASLASVCERDTKAGSVIGAPLLCFGVFSILRCELANSLAHDITQTQQRFHYNASSIALYVGSRGMYDFELLSIHIRFRTSSSVHHAEAIGSNARSC